MGIIKIKNPTKLTKPQSEHYIQNVLAGDCYVVIGYRIIGVKYYFSMAFKVFVCFHFDSAQRFPAFSMFSHW